MRTAGILTFGCIAVLGSSVAGGIDLDGVRFVDLTHPFNADTVY